VRDLKQRGGQFEEHGFPGFGTAASIARIGEDRGARFNDSDGDLLGILRRRQPPRRDRRMARAPGMPAPAAAQIPRPAVR
jgi:hypothetical protein